MTTITEDYVSFETAKLLKEKGFPQEYNNYHALVYNEEDYEDEYEVQRMVLETKLVKAGTLSSYPVGVPEPKCYCCTVQMAMKWLREVHHIHIVANVDVSSPSFFIDINKKDYDGWVSANNDTSMVYSGETIFTKTFRKYEEACEAALKYCLENLI